MTSFDVTRIREPELVFAGGEQAKDPRAGLLDYGPCPRVSASEPEVVGVGVVGDSRSIATLTELLRKMRTGIKSKKQRQRWKQPFPGLGVDSELGFDYELREDWKGRILPRHIDVLEDVRKQDDRVERALTYIDRQIENVCEQTPSPDVVFVAIPDRLAEICSVADAKTQAMRTDESDFRSRIKLFGMQYGTPTQLVAPKTLRGEDVQERSEVAWNIAVGMLYKAREGRPWKLAQLKSRTCYAGISFYDERGDDPDTRASVAQVFIEDGRNFVIRGDPIEDLASGSARTHLSYEDAKRLVESILDKYGDYKEDRPERLVLHKSSNFWDEETEGFSDGASDVREKEFLTIRKEHPLRFFTEGDYPPLRGTLAVPPGEREYYLYTKGFVPEQSAYNDPASPKPIVIRPHDEYYSGDYRRICQEILSFTKLDWNSSDFCKRLPVTIGIADAVSDILAEPAASGVDLDTHYYYYM